MRKITVLYICHAPDNLGGAALSLSNLIDSVKCSVSPIVLLPKKGQVYTFFTKMGIKCIISNFDCNLRNPNYFIHIVGFVPKLIWYRLKEVKDIYRICKLVKDSNINIVHSNSSVFTIGVKIAKRLRVKHIWHIREFQDLDFGMSPFLGWIHLKKLLYTTDATISITDTIYKHWELEGKNNAYCYGDAVRSKNDSILLLDKKKYIVFCAAIISNAKGAEIAVESFGKSDLAKDGYRLKMIGKISEEYTEKLNKIADTYKITNNIDYLGYCDSIKEIMSQATAFLMCSQNEGLGRVTIEAMFYGCPVIAKKSGGTMTFLKNNNNGFLFTNCEECASLMVYIVKYPAITNNIIKNANKTAIKNFSEETYGTLIMKIYKSLLHAI